MGIPGIPGIGGYASDHAAFVIDLGPGGVFKGITEWNISESIEEAKLRGTNRVPYKRTKGVYNVESFTVTMPTDEADRLVGALGPKWGDRIFPATIVRQADMTVPPSIKVVKDCRIVGREDGSSEGAEAAMTTFTMSAMEVVSNGLAMASLGVGL